MTEDYQTVSLNTAVKRCTCKHEYQDKRYGKGMRLHNECQGGSRNTPGWRCTVCETHKPK
jgi:hypothetical protein